MKTFIDLFCGIGGFHVALQQRGLECVFASEIDERAAGCYAANFGMQPHGDIMKIPAEDIPAHDVLCAGFPCQAFSRAGKGKAMADERGQLFYEIIRIAKHHQPEVLILENVPQILNICGGAVKKELMDLLTSIGYKTTYAMLNSGDFGVPQARKRVFFVAIRNDSPLKFTYPLPLPFTAQMCVEDILMPAAETAHLVLNRNDIVFDHPIDPHRGNRLNRIGYIGKNRQSEKIYDIGGHAPTQSVSSGRQTGIFYVPKPKASFNPPQANRIYNTKGHAPTQMSGGGGGGAKTGLYLQDGKIRTLHINESKLVMGFPVTHIVSQGTQGFKEMGNAVVPAVVGAVFDNIQPIPPAHKGACKIEIGFVNTDREAPKGNPCQVPPSSS